MSDISWAQREEACRGTICRDKQPQMGCWDRSYIDLWPAALLLGAARERLQQRHCRVGDIGAANPWAPLTPGTSWAQREEAYRGTMCSHKQPQMGCWNHSSYDRRRAGLLLGTGREGLQGTCSRV